ncbi:restriction endonuclease [Allisonella histaminiformans]|uniref:restriction endonuclease n=1 Tax=Allisonella histaminiformans TaxID=209880 RepID=UPI002E7AA41C|nr:restriction endonuclease [Allisonella histaminiformans]
MSIPTYNEFYDSILELLSDGQIHNSKETIEYCANAFQLSDEERMLRIPSNRQTVLANRVGWARTYLKKAGLITAHQRGQYKITEAGLTAVKDKNAKIDNDYLSRFPEFRKFINNPSVDPDGSNPPKEPNKTPQEIINDAYEKIMQQLSDELLENIMGQTPAFFERLVMELLEKMGYGGDLIRPSLVTGKTGDEGIDGIIRQDVLGFDKIYVQAKRWADDHTVGGPEIQKFAGALMGQGASKGLFITTSYFSNAAKDFVGKYLSARIVLIDGEKLAQLMIKYGLGVSMVHSYEIKQIDGDYFSDGEE